MIYYNSNAELVNPPFYVYGCNNIRTEIYSLYNGTLSGGHFIEYLLGQAQWIPPDNPNSEIIPSAWGIASLGCREYMLFDFDSEKLYFFGDAFKSNGSRIVSNTESNKLVKMVKDLHTTQALNGSNAIEKEGPSGFCIDFCDGSSFIEIKNQTYYYSINDSMPIVDRMKEYCKCVN